MDTLTLDCLCLKSVNWSESDRIVTLYAVDTGKISAKVKGCRKAGAKLAAAASPLNFGRYYLTAVKNKYTVTGCDIYDTFFDIGNDIERYYAACVVIEFIDKTQPDYDYNNDLMIASLDALKRLCCRKDDSQDIVADFLTDALRHIGYACERGSLRRLGNFLYLKTDVVLSSLKGYLSMIGK
ncbi:MAG: DNA repair protein RecO [Clostridia bacterium]|nr:DNA repair protein RecO [Clostridia bacterium]